MSDLAVGDSQQPAGPLTWWHRPVPSRAAAAWSELARHPTAPPQDFDPASLDDLPPPARRLLDRALPRHTPLGTAVHLGMAGRLRVDGQWLPFVGEEILRAGIGYVWHLVRGRRLVRLLGADVLSPSGCRTELRLHGLVPIVRRREEPVSRRAAERLACETVSWLPQALTPQAGAQWHEGDGEHAVVTLSAAGRRVDVEVSVDVDGRLRSVALHRCHAAGVASGADPVGGMVEREFVTDHGITIAGGGTASWWSGPGGRAQAQEQLVHYTVSSARTPSRS